MCTIQYTIRNLCIFLQEVSLAGEKSSVIGAASIFCARSVLKVSPVWPQHLESLFDLSLSDFSHCSNLLLATYAESEVSDNPTESPQSLLEVILKRIFFLVIIFKVIFIFQTLDEINHETPQRKRPRYEESTPDEGYLSRSSYREEEIVDRSDFMPKDAICFNSTSRKKEDV